MPKDLAPLLRIIAIVAALVLIVPFALMLKGGAFRNENVVILIFIGSVLLSAAVSIFIVVEQTRDAKLPNPLHPENKPTDPPAA